MDAHIYLFLRKLVYRNKTILPSKVSKRFQSFRKIIRFFFVCFDFFYYFCPRLLKSFVDLISQTRSVTSYGKDSPRRAKER